MQIEPHQLQTSDIKQSVMSIIPLQFRQICQQNRHEEQVLVSCHVIRSVSMVKVAAVTPLTSEHPPSLSYKHAVAQVLLNLSASQAGQRIWSPEPWLLESLGNARSLPKVQCCRPCRPVTVGTCVMKCGPVVQCSSSMTTIAPNVSKLMAAANVHALLLTQMQGESKGQGWGAKRGLHGWGRSSGDQSCH